MRPDVVELAQQVLAGQSLSREDAGPLTTLAGDDLYDLFYWANKIRIRFVGPQIRFCAIVAAKVGGCSEDCKFCAQSAHYQTSVGGQSRLSDRQILHSAQHAASVGADSFGIVNSGRGPTRSELEDWLAPIMKKIASDGKTRACATLGTLTPQTAKFLYDCGIRRINHNIETSRRHYPNIITTHSFDERIRTLKAAKAAGLELCSGGIFGMGENWDDRLDMLYTLRELGVNVMPINFLNPIAGTPLEHVEKLSPMECLKIIAICRFVLPGTELKVAGGREVCLRDLQSWMFYAGASSTMIGNYLTTYGRSPELDHQMVRDLGLSWAPYGEAAPPEPSQQAPAHVVRTGKHSIPILYERETTASASGLICG